MAKVLAPNKDYDGISAGVRFVKGVGECDDPWLLDWFKRKGYEVVEEDKPGEQPGQKSKPEPKQQPKEPKQPKEKPQAKEE